ncbi:hypothetical protein C0992_007070 [Termitomyces sp. T32_za158]|nr:hypothetical protein C0992_007070 [Termitomyces sp. T32_za158]
MALFKPSFPLSVTRLQKLSLVVPNQATSAALKAVLDQAGGYLDNLELSFTGVSRDINILNLPNPGILRHVKFRSLVNDISQITLFLLQIPEVNKLSSVLIDRTSIYSGSIPRHDTEDSS